MCYLLNESERYACQHIPRSNLFLLTAVEYPLMTIPHVGHSSNDQQLKKYS